MGRRSPAPSCGDLRQADETNAHAHHAGFVIGASTSAYCPDQAPPRSVNVRTTPGRLGGRVIHEPSVQRTRAPTAGMKPIIHQTSKYSANYVLGV